MKIKKEHLATAATVLIGIFWFWMLFDGNKVLIALMLLASIAMHAYHFIKKPKDIKNRQVLTFGCYNYFKITDVIFLPLLVFGAGISMYFMEETRPFGIIFHAVIFVTIIVHLILSRFHFPVEISKDSLDLNFYTAKARTWKNAEINKIVVTSSLITISSGKEVVQLLMDDQDKIDLVALNETLQIVFQNKLIVDLD